MYEKEEESQAKSSLAGKPAEMAQKAGEVIKSLTVTNLKAGAGTILHREKCSAALKPCRPRPCEPLKAKRYQQEGVQDKTGVNILSETTLVEDAGKVLGLNPARAREALDAKCAIYQRDKALQQRRQHLMKAFVNAQVWQQNTGPALQAIQAYNALHPSRAIAPLHLQQSVRQRMLHIATAEQDVFLSKGRRDAGWRL